MKRRGLALMVLAWLLLAVPVWADPPDFHPAHHRLQFRLGMSVYATDVDGDGDTDVLGAGAPGQAITWWENDGNENFTKHIIDGDFDGPYSVYATDVDGDGDTDVLGAGAPGQAITWWENDGSQNFTKHNIDGAFSGASSVYAIDVDGDGDVDILGAASNDADITWWENISLLRNASFEDDGLIPVPWEGRNLDPDDRRGCRRASEGSCSFKMIGTTAYKALKQVLNISGSAGDTYTLSGWSWAKDPLRKGGPYCLQANIRHTDGTVKNHGACFTKETHEWEYKEKAFTVAKDYDRIVIVLRYADQGSKAWFDDVRLVAH